MGFQLTIRDMNRLTGVHPDLVQVIQYAAAHSEQLFIVTEGVRSLEHQKELVAAGKSQTMKSRHIKESNACRMGCAVDLAVWEDRDADKVVDADEISWKFPQYKALADVMKASGEALGIPIEWGGGWVTLKDGPHFQLPWAAYP